MFSSSVTSLLANTTYYRRAYATNSAGTGYGSILSVITFPVEKKMRLFEGYTLKILDGTTLRLYSN